MKSNVEIKRFTNDKEILDKLKGLTIKDVSYDEGDVEILGCLEFTLVDKKGKEMYLAVDESGNYFGEAHEEVEKKVAAIEVPVQVQPLTENTEFIDKIAKAIGQSIGKNIIRQTNHDIPLG